MLFSYIYMYGRIETHQFTLLFHYCKHRANTIYRYEKKGGNVVVCYLLATFEGKKYLQTAVG